MKRLALIAAAFAVTACNNAAKEKARMDSIAADSTAKAMAAQMAADSARKADSVAAAMKAAASKPKTGTKR